MVICRGISAPSPWARPLPGPVGAVRPETWHHDGPVSGRQQGFDLLLAALPDGSLVRIPNGEFRRVDGAATYLPPTHWGPAVVAAQECEDYRNLRRGDNAYWSRAGWWLTMAPGCKAFRLSGSFRRYGTEAEAREALADFLGQAVAQDALRRLFEGSKGAMLIPPGPGRGRDYCDRYYRYWRALRARSAGA